MAGGRTLKDVRTEAYAVIAAMAPGQAELTDDTDLRAGLLYDSVRLIELTMALEQHFGMAAMNLDDAMTVTRVGDVVALVDRTLLQREA
jgi:acyl carrier protein